MSEWRPSACILCECNCGIEVKLGGEGGRHFVKIRGDRKHPTSKGYLCEKAGRLDHYQNSRDRLLSPMRRRPDGSYEAIDWDTAIREVAQRLAKVRDEAGGDSIFYYGGGGQGNHLPGTYATATRRALGSRFRSNALAQEKTGLFYVAQQMLGVYTRGDFEHCEVGVFVGKNPWQSHGLARARVVLKELSRDPERCLIVIDPVRTESAELADIHLAPRPGTDAWLLAALLAALVEDGLLADDWLAEHTVGLPAVLPLLREVPIAAFCEACGVPEEQVRAVAQRIGAANSVALYEDLGVQMNRHSTLVSYLDRLLWLLTGNFGRVGTQLAPSALVPLASGGSKGRVSPVTGSPLIGGLVPCNVIPEEILTDHPRRFRAMIVETANPAHSLADSTKMREALGALDCLVVIDIAMTETARLADYVLPTPTQFEKAEATFFNFEFPANSFHLRQPLLEPPGGVLTEAEIHTRLCEALGAIPDGVIDELRTALETGGRLGFAVAFQMASMKDPRIGQLAAAILHRTLGEALPTEVANAAALWGVSHMAAAKKGDSIRRAGIEGDGPMLGEALFDAIVGSPSGLVFSVDPPEESWKRVRGVDGRIQLEIPELLAELAGLADAPRPGDDPDWPFLLSAGERRTSTANTIYRDPAWRKKDRGGALRMHPADAARLGLDDGGDARVTTAAGSAVVAIEVSRRMQPGHVALPNGLGLDYPDESGTRRAAGVSPNELTSVGHRDKFAGTPWHKSVPARIEAVAAP